MSVSQFAALTNKQFPRLVEHTRVDGSQTKKVKPYMMDLESTNGSFLNNVKIEPRR